MYGLLSPGSVVLQNSRMHLLLLTISLLISFLPFVSASRFGQCVDAGMEAVWTSPDAGLASGLSSLQQHPSDPTEWMVLSEKADSTTVERIFALKVHSNGTITGRALGEASDLTLLPYNRVTGIAYVVIDGGDVYALNTSEPTWFYHPPTAQLATLPLRDGLDDILSSVAFGDLLFVLIDDTSAKATFPLRVNLTNGEQMNMTVPSAGSVTYMSLSTRGYELLYVNQNFQPGVYSVKNALAVHPDPPQKINLTIKCVEPTAAMRIPWLAGAHSRNDSDAPLLVICTQVGVIVLNGSVATVVLPVSSSPYQNPTISPAYGMIATIKGVTVMAVQYSNYSDSWQSVNLMDTSDCGGWILSFQVDWSTGLIWMVCTSTLMRNIGESLSPITTVRDCSSQPEQVTELGDGTIIAFACANVPGPFLLTGQVVVPVTNPLLQSKSILLAAATGGRDLYILLNADGSAVPSLAIMYQNGSAKILGSMGLPSTVVQLLLDQTQIAYVVGSGAQNNVLMQLQDDIFVSLLELPVGSDSCSGIVSRPPLIFAPCNSILMVYNSLNLQVTTLYDCQAASWAPMGGRIDHADGSSTIWFVCTGQMLEFDIPVIIPVQDGTIPPLVNRTYNFPAGSVCTNASNSVFGSVRDVQRNLFYLLCAPFSPDGSFGSIQMFGWSPENAEDMKLLLTNDDCPDLTLSMVGSRTSTLYLYCKFTQLFAYADGYRCNSGSEWSYGTCSTCPVGTARNAVSFNASEKVIPTCRTCRDGTVATMPGTGICQNCPIGTFQDLSVRAFDQVCTPCSPGRANAYAAQTICAQCEAGKFSNQSSMTQCFQCGPGSYSATLGGSFCLACGRGSASNATGLAEPCPLCPPGTEATQFGSEECAPCNLGSSSPEAGSVCSICLPNFYTPQVGSTCISCESQQGLVCQNGIASVLPNWWAFQVYDADIGLYVWNTTPCPLGFCQSHPLQDNSSPTNGSDSMGNIAAPIIFCEYPRLNDPSNWLCARCIEGYIAWGNQCQPCTNGLDWPLLLLLLLVGFITVLFLLRQVSSASSAGLLTLLLYFSQTAALEIGALVHELTWFQAIIFRNQASKNAPTCLAPLTPVQQTLLMYSLPLILIAILAIMAMVHRTMRNWMIKSRDAAPVVTPQVSIPPTSGPSVWMKALTRWLTSSMLDYRTDRYIGCVFAILLTAYTPLCVSVVQSLHCVQAGPDHVLLFDTPSVDCNSDEYRLLLLPVTIVVGLIFILGFPIVIFAFLRKHRADIRTADHVEDADVTISEHSKASSSWIPGSPDPSSASLPEISIAETSSRSSFYLKYGVLFRAFRRSEYAWQSFVLLRRVLLALISVLIRPTEVTRYTLFTALHTVSALLQEHVAPFASKAFNQAEGISHLLLIAISLLLASSSTQLSNTLQITLILLSLPWSILLLSWLCVEHMRNFKDFVRRIRAFARRRKAFNSERSLTGLSSSLLEDSAVDVHSIDGAQSPIATSPTVRLSNVVAGPTSPLMSNIPIATGAIDG